MKTRICICRYPLIVTDKRLSDDVVHLSMPLEVIQGMSEMPIPDMELVEDVEGFDGKKGTYMKVVWRELSSIAKKYNVNEHIVLAGCPEDQLSCNEKSIFEVYHPIGEWKEYHMLELK